MQSSLLALSLTVVCLGSGAGAETDEPARFSVRVRETAGIRRFGYPVTTELPINPPAPPTTQFRLLHLGKPVAAQFRVIKRQGDQISSVALDFDSNFMPHESREYVVEFGASVVPQEPDRGMLVEETDDSFLVSNGPSLVWAVPKNLSSLIRSVKTPKWDYLRPDSAGLSVRLRDDSISNLSDAQKWRCKGRVAKQGPIDCSLHFEGVGLTDATRDVAWTVELGFPRSKSWVRVLWRVEDPKQILRAFVGSLNLQVGDGPTLVDFGADELVYAVVPDGQVAVLEAGRAPGSGRQNDPPWPSWTTYRGRPGQLEPYVVGGLRDPALLRGWAHVMDRQRCSAIAIDAFAADRATDRIEVSSDGRLEISRQFPAQVRDVQNGTNRLDFWVHFVPFPPHVGAVTSPQSMQSPLEVLLENRL